MHCPPPTYHLGPDFDRLLTQFVRDFLSEGFDKLGGAFVNVEQFVKRAEADTSDRDDHELRRTPKEQYLLEAVAYKIYDQTNRASFNATRNTLIILPDCLTLHNADCLKQDTHWGERCLQCTGDCQASQVVDLAARYQAEVVFSKRKLEQQIEHFAQARSNLGVIGVGCLLMLANGMRTAIKLGVPVRGVLLSFTGCEHWNEKPFASAFPLEQLEAILREKYEHHH